MQRALLLTIFTVISFLTFAQTEGVPTEEKQATVFLKGGTRLDVTIIDWDLEKGLKATTLWGQKMFFPKDQIKKVKSFSNESKLNPYHFRQRGIYYALYGGLITSNHGQRFNDANGYTLSFASGYRFHRLFSLGLGGGIDQYADNSGERVYPIFVDLRSFLFASNTTYVFNVQTGYSLAFNDATRGIMDSQGGFMFYPNIGLSFGSSDAKFSFDVGYKFQNATWTYTDLWEVRNRTEYRLDYKRFVIRFGVVL
jgi:hypothetical protein